MSRLSIELHAAFCHAVHFFEQRSGIDHHAVPDDARLALVQNPGGDQVQDELVRAHDHRMARVVAALIARNDIRPLGKQVDDLSLPLVAPLGADNY